jgi:hypothetical protein
MYIFPYSAVRDAATKPRNKHRGWILHRGPGVLLVCAPGCP